MRTIDLLRAIRQYDEAKERLKSAEENMARVRAMVKATGQFMPSFFTYRQEFIVETISEMKKAYFAFEELFKDHSYEQMMEYEKMMAKAANDVFRIQLRLEHMIETSAREVL